MPRTIAIGDIHGCAAALTRLLAAIEPRADDRLIVLGDMIDRGPDTRAVIDQLLDLGRSCRLTAVLGNHEEMLLSLRGQPKASALASWINYGGAQTLLSYGPHVGPNDLPRAHVEFLEACVPYVETQAHVFVHANYDANLPLEEQSSFTLRWESLRDRIPSRHVSGKTFVLGHTPQPEGRILDRGYLVCIDTHCYASGWLTALDVHTGAFWQASQRSELRHGERPV